MNQALLAALDSDLRRWFARRSPQDADDLVQETLLRVHTGLPALRDDTRLDGWVSRVRRSVWVDHLRRKRPSEPVGEIAVDADPVERATEHVAGWLPAFVDALAEPYREAVRLADLEGMSQADLADRLGLSSSGARTRVQRGRAMLKAELDACCTVRWEGGEVSDIERRCGC